MASNQSKSQTCPTFEQVDPKMLKPAPENEKLYRPVSANDPDIIRMADDIAVNGLLEPLVVSGDGYILSGHRRQTAAIVAGLETIPVRRVNVRRGDPEFIKLLASYNRQRIKDRSEQMREAIVLTDPDEAYQALIDHRKKKSQIKANTIEVGTRGVRKAISAGKRPFADAVIHVVNEHRKYWPLSDRQVHYRLLNNPPLKHAKKPGSRYKNDRASYQDLCDILVRLRLEGEIPMHAIEDPTRPTTSWSVHRNAQDFVFEELAGFLKGYRRNLQQTQPLHIEVVAEKMTLEAIIRPVCGRFNIPYTIARGFSSLPARWQIVQRFRDSGKDKLVLLVLSDFDPEGISIGETLVQSLREDFGESHAEAIRVGLNPEHIHRFRLIDRGATAKTSSSRCKTFVQKYGKKVYELEAITPVQLKTILTESIDSIIDADAFNQELQAEKHDAHYIGAVRSQIHDAGMEILSIEGGW